MSQEHMIKEGASSQADWAISGPFWVMAIFPANLDVLTWSKKVATPQKKVLKLGIHNINFFAFWIDEKVLKKVIFCKTFINCTQTCKWWGQSQFFEKTLYTLINLKLKNNNILYTQFWHFFFSILNHFHQVMTTRFGGLHQKRPEIDQPALPVVEFTLTCGKARWGQA